MTIHAASNAAEFRAALSRAVAGDQIKLASGNYGDVNLNDFRFGSTVTITASDATKPPVFNTIKLWKCSNLTFDNIDIKFQPTATTTEGASGFRADYSSKISVLNSTIKGGAAVGGTDPGTVAGGQGDGGIKGMPIGDAMDFIGCTDVVIEKTDISVFTSGIRFATSENIVVRDTEIHHVRKVPVGGGDVSNVLIANNYFHDITPWKFGGLGDHGDHIHFWTRPTQDGASTNIKILNNFFAQGDGVSVLGIYLDDDNNNIGFRDVLIEGNVMHNGNAQAVRFEDVVGAIIRDNTFIQSSGTPQDAPQVYLKSETRNVLIEGNILSGVAGELMANAAANGIKVVGNMPVQIHDPLAPNYVGDVFLDALADNPKLADLVLVPGSSAAGYGASSSQHGSAGAPTSFITAGRGTGLGLDEHKFSVMELGQGGARPAQATKVTWDFGDGTKGAGLNLDHAYAKAGTYLAKATVTYADGTTKVLDKTVRVLDPVAVQSDFSRGFVDTSDIAQSVKTVGLASLVQTDHGQSLRLKGSNAAVTYDTNDEMMRNPEFSISFSFKKDAGAEGAGGRVFYYSGTAIVDVLGNAVVLRGRTDAGENILLEAGNLGVNDSKWHRITYTFSKEDGAAILYVDGRAVDRMDGLKGGQYVQPSHDMHLGNPFGGNIAGVLDDLVFFRAALTPQQVASGSPASLGDTVMGGGSVGKPVPTPVDPTPTPVDPTPKPTPPAEEQDVVSMVKGRFVAWEGTKAVDLGAVPKMTTDGLQLGATGVAARIDRDHVMDVVGAEDMTIAFKLDADAKGSAGELFRLHGSFVAGVTSTGELNFRLMQDGEKTISLTTKGAALNGTIEKDRSIVVNLEDGKLQIWVDNKLMGETPAGSPVGGVNTFATHDLVFGNPFGRANFKGDISAFEVSVGDEAPVAVAKAAPSAALATVSSAQEDDVDYAFDASFEDEGRFDLVTHHQGLDLVA